jgi:hypothetical protein
VATSSDLDFDSLIIELGVSLAPPQRDAFERVARDILITTRCSGIGAAYRTLAPLQRAYFDPPDDNAARGAPRHLRRRTADASPIEDDSVRGAVSRRSRWMRGWRG